ncbi:MAG: pilus assembly protein TadG-related protein [Candidatus Melainabacteria bacterium]|nr:pilus assembly protein TadG-related protein [Candidatus Melainabacteria bacterium]
MKSLRAFGYASSIATIGVTLFGLMMSALAVDTGFYFVNLNYMQTAADAAALAAARTLVTSTAATPELRQQEAIATAESVAHQNYNTLDVSVNFGYMDPEAEDPAFGDPSNDSNYSYSGGVNALQVVARKEGSVETGAIPTIFANLLGVESMDGAVQAMALLDNNISRFSSGVRPVYVCQAQYDLANNDGNVSNNTVRIYGKQFYVDGVTNISGCPVPGSGNWGFADLRDCDSGSVGASTIGDWFAEGYPGTVESGQCYSTKPGNFLNSNQVTTELNKLIASQEVIVFPLINSFNGNGSNTNVDVTGFTGFVITGYDPNGGSGSGGSGGNGNGNGNSGGGKKGGGSSSGDSSGDSGTTMDGYIQGYFVPAACGKSCSSVSGVNSTGNVNRIRLVR